GGAGSRRRLEQTARRTYAPRSHRCHCEVEPTMTQETPEVRVHYAKGWAITILIGAGLLLAMAPYVRTWMTGVIGALNLVAGILMLTRPLYVLGDGALQVKNL